MPNIKDLVPVSPSSPGVGSPTDTPNSSSTAGAPSSGGWTNFLPTIGGIAGNVIGRIGGGILGGVAGTAAEPGGGTILGAFGGEEAGGAALGSAGQAAGEFLKEFLQGKPTDTGEITKQGVEGAIYGAIPGGEASNFVARTEARAGIGAVTGAATQGIEDLGNNKSASENAGNITEAGILGGVINPVLGGLGDLVFKTLPNDLINLAVKEPEKTAQTLFTQVKQSLVGREFVDTAVKDGIIPEGDIASPASGKSGHVVASGLSNSIDVVKNGLKVTNQVFSKVDSQLTDLLESAPHVSFTEKSSELRNIINNAENQVSTSARGTQLKNTLENVMTQNVDPSDLSLKVVSDMKRALNPFYDLPGVSKLQNSLNTLITDNLEPEQKGVYEEVKKHLQDLIGIKDNLTTAKDLKVDPKTLTPQAIQDAVNKAGQGAPQSMKTTAGWMAILGMTGVGAAIKGAEGAVTGAAAGGVGMMMGIRRGIENVLDGIFSSPENKLELANGLRYVFNKYPSLQQPIISALKQIAARIPQAATQQNSATPATPPPVINSPGIGAPNL